MKKASIYIIMVMLLLVAGCRKDSTIDGMLIVSESMRGDSKAMVDDLSLNWVAGESIRINGKDMNIVVNGDNQAYLENVPTSSVYRALYPATLNSSASLDDDNVTVTIPDTYTYTVNGGKQVLEVPMAARSTDGSRLYFKHLTAAITVEITNYYGFAVLVDSVVVTSSDAGTEHQISGVTNINLTNDSMGITLNNSPTLAQKKVKMLFGDGAHAMKIDQGATKKVQVPVLPVGNGNKFSISVTVHKDGDAAVTKTFTKTQVTGGAMGRAKMAYAGHTVGFLFSIGNNKKVIISQGNLQYQASSNTWRFAEHQYDYIGAQAGNTTTAADRATQSAWIDLFGWGTSGWNNGNTYYMPYDILYGGEASGYGYGPTNGSAYTFSLTGPYAHADWGIHDTISNGGNATGMWRTLTGGNNSETDTLFKYRSTTTSNMPTGEYSVVAKFIKANIQGKNGIILFPDNYIHPTGIDVSVSNCRYNTINNSSPFGSFVVNKTNWAKMEAAGAIFIPAAGHRDGNVNILDVGTVAWYWSSTVVPIALGAGNSYAIKIFNGNSSLSEKNARNKGCSVRLVMDVR